MVNHLAKEALTISERWFVPGMGIDLNLKPAERVRKDHGILIPIQLKLMKPDFMLDCRLCLTIVSSRVRFIVSAFLE